MSFDTDAFKSVLATQCATSSVESSHAWNLGPDVFAALVREKGGAGNGPSSSILMRMK